MAIFCLCVLTGAPSVGATVRDEPPTSALEVLVDGSAIALPILKTELTGRLQGNLATVRVTQTFANPQSVPLHARYIFPLPANAAVYAMRVQSGDRLIEAQIQRRQEARAIYQAAVRRGNQAALLTQHRPNVFTQEVANLVPGAPVRVVLEYVHAIEKVGGEYQFHFPMVVGPRYLPELSPGEEAGAPARRQEEPGAVEAGRWNLPASSPVAPPNRVDRDRVSIELELDAGLPIRWLDSPSHRLEVDRPSEYERVIRLARLRVLDNRDFMLHYRLAGDEVAAGATTSVADGIGYVSLLIEPPPHASQSEITPREVVFVLDCSGSMSGIPMAASKRLVRSVLPRLRETDYFRIIRFSDAATSWSNTPMRATAANVRAGQQYIDSLHGGGGTEMTSGIREALAPSVPDGALRLVVFLTDGYIGNDVEIVRLIQARRGEARFFSFGVGTGVNRYLIREMARVGRGAARIVLPSEDAETAAEELAARLESPILTDVEIAWGDAPVESAFPSDLPDLFLGQSLRVTGRYEGGGQHRIEVRGRIAGRPVQLPLDLDLPPSEGSDEASLGGAALPILWARAQIEDRMTSYLNPAYGPAEREELKEEVTQLGLQHRIVTQWTSFVAVARRVVNPGGFGDEADVAVPKVHGVSNSAYPESALPGKSGPGSAVAGSAGQQGALVAVNAFHGSAAPEPESWIALLFLALVGGLWLRRQPRGSVF